MDFTEEQSTEIVTQCRGIQKIDHAQSYVSVTNTRGLLKEMIAFHQDDAAEGIENAKRTLQGLRANLEAKIDPLQTEYNRLGGLMSQYNAEQERLKEQKRRELEAEQKRQRDEDAKLAKELGDKGLAKKIMAQDLPPVFVEKDVPKVEGVAFVDTWHYEVTSLEDLVKAVAAGKVPIQAIADPSKPFRSGYLHIQVTRLRDTLKWPGVKVWRTTGPRQQ